MFYFSCIINSLPWVISVCTFRVLRCGLSFHCTDSMLNVVFSVIRFSHSFFVFSVLDTNFSSNSVFSFPIFYVFRVSECMIISNEKGLLLSVRMATPLPCWGYTIRRERCSPSVRLLTAAKLLPFRVLNYQWFILTSYPYGSISVVSSRFMMTHTFSNSIIVSL